MGKNFLDQYTYLHFCVGVISYFFGITFRDYFILHLVFEIIENTNIGMQFINKYLGNIWPGGKPTSDSLLNSCGDHVFSMLGWYSAYLLEQYGMKHKWYELHISK